MHAHSPERPAEKRSGESTSPARASRTRSATLFVLAVAALLLALDHRAHLLGWLPWLLLLACPLMHLLMHHGHRPGRKKP